MRDEKIVTLYGENGKKIEFYLDAVIEYEDDIYQILRPINENLELKKDEALVFLVEEIDGEKVDRIELDCHLFGLERIYMTTEE